MRFHLVLILGYHVPSDADIILEACLKLYDISWSKLNCYRYYSEESNQ